MKFIRLLITLCVILSPLCAVEITKGGIIPSYKPYHLGSMCLFLPYNTHVIIVGDDIWLRSQQLAKINKSKYTVFAFSLRQNDFMILKERKKTLPNLHAYFGLVDEQPTNYYTYYESEHCTGPDEKCSRIPGSLLEPIDTSLPFLFGKKDSIPTFNFSQFCQAQGLSKVHLLHLNCGGTELNILQSNPELTKKAIVVAMKTYHKPIRKNLPTFDDIHKFMTDCDFYLMSHYIYDGIIGDALYVKKAYFRAVFQSKEI